MSASTIYVTASTLKEATEIARTTVNERLAACANILGSITSVYFWNGRVEEGTETALILKTRRDLVPALTERIKEIHSYDCPCITSLNITEGNPDYIDWINSETR